MIWRHLLNLTRLKEKSCHIVQEKLKFCEVLFPVRQVGGRESDRSGIAKNRLWTTIKLLESFSSNYHSRVNARFEADVLKCTALGELCKLLRTTDVAKKGLIPKVQTDWVASIGKDDLEKMLADSMGEAKRFFEDLPEPTESQQALKKQLDKLDKEINQTKSQ